MITKIKNLRLNTIIGVFDWEEKVNREIIINIEITSSDNKAAYSDNIADAIDYDSLVLKVKNLVANNRFKLVEKLAQSVIDEILKDRRIKKCKVEVDKVGAVENVESFSVTIEQENQ